MKEERSVDEGIQYRDMPPTTGVAERYGLEAMNETYAAASI